ncbi:MAG: hydrolase [Homoserinimonas sp.]|nr:hydrolase [Homoserinimonas sp.]
MTELLPSGVLWDMDGTIVDTEPYWMRAEEDLVHSFGGSWTRDDAMSVVGSDLWDAARVFQAHGVDLDEATIIARLTDQVLEQAKVRIPWRPGARELLLQLKDAAIPAALVTMSLRRMADQIVDAIGFPAFAAVVGGDDVPEGKPHPAPYLRGAELLGFRAEECVALEDSHTGLASAVASGAATIAVPLHLSIPESSEYTLWPSLEGKTVADLGTVFRNTRSGVAS